MAGLGVNIDHVATIRQARRTVEPDPVWAAAEAQLAGADCITFHLRKDRRHINDRDAGLLRQSVSVKVNMEMSMDEEIVGIALALRPHQATLVPENRQEITTEGGLDVAGHLGQVREATMRLREAGVSVSLFIDPSKEQIDAACQCGAQEVEFHTGQYCLARSEDARLKELALLYTASEYARERGLIVNAGHGLNYHNVLPVAAIEGMRELNIGHSIISRAVFDGLRAAVEEMAALIDRATRSPQSYRPQGI
jgi:pyridoxine 5-phosphate synthase